MTNPFSPTTTGGSAGQFVYNDIDGRKNAQTRATALSRFEKYEQEDQQKVDNYVVVMEALDQTAIDKINIINSKKQQILTIINNAISGIGGNPEFAFTGTFLDQAAAESDTTAAKILFSAGITTFAYACAGLPPVCSLGAKAAMYPDTLIAWHYPNVENLNPNVTFYRQGESYTTVVGNLGIGITAYEVGDADGVTPDVSGIVTSTSSLGDYYFFSDIDSIISGSSADIFNLITDIEELRSEVSDYLGDNSIGTNKIRYLKSDAQINLWFEKKGQQVVPVRDFVGGLNAMTENSVTIQDYTG